MSKALEYIKHLNKTVLKNFPINEKTLESDCRYFSAKYGENYLHLYFLDMEYAYFEMREKFSDDFVLRRIIYTINRMIKYANTDTVEKSYKAVLKKVTEDTHTFYNFVNILNESGILLDSKLLYDSEGFCKSDDDKFMLSYDFSKTKSGYGNEDIEFSYMGVTILEFKKDLPLDELVYKCKKGMLDYTKKKIKYHESEISSLVELAKNYII